MEDDSAWSCVGKKERPKTFVPRSCFDPIEQ